MKTCVWAFEEGFLSERKLKPNLIFKFYLAILRSQLKSCLEKLKRSLYTNEFGFDFDLKSMT